MNHSISIAVTFTVFILSITVAYHRLLSFSLTEEAQERSHLHCIGIVRPDGVFGIVEDLPDQVSQKAVKALFLSEDCAKELSQNKKKNGYKFVFVQKTGQTCTIQKSEPFTGMSSLLCGFKLHINEENEKGLSLLPNIGPARAAEIRNFIKEHGPFMSENDIIRVKGIGPKTVEKILPWIDFK